MPIYHFHSADGAREPDESGIELPDLDTARSEAIRYSGAVLAHSPQQLWRTGHWRVEVNDENNVLLFTVVTLAIDAPKPGDLAKGGNGDRP